ncbi:sirohydrochlorin chelatase [Paenibacillus sp. SAFN-117]|uniref:sirohydrochlorin chelatase n=1 Tax=Paenibacillus sp. SAFN-117 TaxID=3436860 RepID=UPI003F80C58D
MKKTAVLVVAHGSPDPGWVELVDETVRQAGLRLPVHIGYLGGVPEQGIAAQLIRLERIGMRHVLVVPLFVSEGSTHLNEIRYSLGLIPAPAVATDLQRLIVKVRLHWCPPLEDDVRIMRILEERLRELSSVPAGEALLTVGHGSAVPGFQEAWENLLLRVTERLRRQFGFSAAAYATLRPDTVAAQAKALLTCGRLLVLPLFLSEGYFTNRAIPDRLEGIHYSYTGKAYLPHPLIADWIRQTVEQAMETLWGGAAVKAH